jgi:hypothetical protein
MKKYKIIYADPPWSYNDKMTMKGAIGCIRGAKSFYDTMSLEDIKNSSIDVSSEAIGRYDSEYVDYLETYCYISKTSNNKYLCFDIKRRKYEPTPSAKIFAILKTFGVGFLFGVTTGLYVSP